MGGDRHVKWVLRPLGDLRKKKEWSNDVCRVYGRVTTEWVPQEPRASCRSVHTP